MKLSLVICAAFVGLILGTSVGIASADTFSTHHRTASSLHIHNIAVEFTNEVRIEVPEMTVVGYVAPKAKRFVCGEVYTNDVGGRNSDCFWR